MRPRLAQLHQSGATSGQAVVWNATTGQWEPGTVSGSGSAHIIEDSSGTDMTARGHLQFVGATVTDDSANDRTLVTISSGGGGSSGSPDGVDLTGTDDYTFSATSSSLPTGWSYETQGTGATALTWAEGNGRGVLTMAGSFTYNRGIYRALPGTFNSAMFRVSFQPGTGNEGAGPFLRGSSGQMAHFTMRASGASNLTFFATSTGAVGTDLGGYGWGSGMVTDWYFKIVKNSSSSWDWLFGPSPTNLTPYFSAVNVPTASAGFTPTGIGFGFLCLGGGLKQAAIDYVKFT